MTVEVTTQTTDAQLTSRTAALVIDLLKLNIPASSITEETNLYELGLDSLTITDLLLSLENELDITVDVEDLSEELFSSFGNLMAFVRSKTDERG
ncbi:acyl carrier protein [Gynuella sp.]|uniref:acyl carrier protein n=1 Tax=Gynuella sp. TaxID=2969146 RepID=UPI003D0BACFB